MSEAAPAVDASQSRPNAGRGSRPNRGASQNYPDDRGRTSGSRGHRGQRGGRGRGRGQGHTRDNASNTRSVETTAEGSSGRPPGGGSGARLTGAASKEEGDTIHPQAKGDGQEVAMEDAEVCFICASPIEHISIAPCNHQTCHICSLRLRALYKTRACAHCRVSTLWSPLCIDLG